MKNKNAMIAGAVVLALLLAVSVWALFLRGDRQYAKLDTMRKDMFQQMPNMMMGSADPAAANKMREASDQFRQELEKLPEEKRVEYMESRQGEMEEQMMQMMNRGMEEFFNLPKEQQNAQIDQMLQQMNTRGGGRGGNPFMMGGFGGRGGPGFGGGQAAQTAQMLERMPPQLRARMDEFGRMMAERMGQRR